MYIYIYIYMSCACGGGHKYESARVCSPSLAACRQDWLAKICTVKIGGVATDVRPASLK